MLLLWQFRVFSRFSVHSKVANLLFYKDSNNHKSAEKPHFIFKYINKIYYHYLSIFFALWRKLMHKYPNPRLNDKTNQIKNVRAIFSNMKSSYDTLFFVVHASKLIRPRTLNIEKTWIGLSMGMPCSCKSLDPHQNCYMYVHGQTSEQT